MRLVLNRPGSHNALTPEMLFGVAEAVKDATADPGVHSVSIEGSGERAFSSGFDIKVLAALGDAAHSGDPLDVATDALVSCPKLTIAAIRGHCLGAGLELAMACDFRIAAAGSHFAVPATRLGTVYRPRAIGRFFAVLGPSVTKALFVAGRDLGADEALRAGIISEVVEPEDLEQAVAGWAKVPENGQGAAAAHKRIIDALAGTADRSAGFWAPFDELRDLSVNSPERNAAIQSFARGEVAEG